MQKTHSAKPILEIDLSAILHNYLKLKKHCTDLSGDSCEVGATVKANSYGLGADKISPTLFNAGCRHFFVANCEEGIFLRSAIGYEANIYVFHGVFSGEAEYFTQHNLIPILNSIDQIMIWQKYAMDSGKKQSCLLHLDTGMNRLGLKELEINSASFDSYLEGLDVLCIISHLSSAEQPGSEYNQRQLDKFIEISKKFKNIPRSLANSSAIFLGAEYHFDLARPGGAIYGLDPMPYKTHAEIKPVVSLSAPIIQLSKLSPGETVGYNETFTNKSNQYLRIATIPVGYADGFLRYFSNRAVVMIGGYEAPIIGLVSMDLTVIDVSNIPENLLYLGQNVELLNSQLTADKRAKLCHTNGYEILTLLGSRYRRIYKKLPEN